MNALPSVDHKCSPGLGQEGVGRRVEGAGYEARVQDFRSVEWLRNRQI